jgi:hypothetical protein
MSTSHRSEYPRHRRLPWPSSSLERDVIHSLMTRARQVGRPVTEMVAEAVIQYMDRHDASSTPQ